VIKLKKGISTEVSKMIQRMASIIFGIVLMLPGCSGGIDGSLPPATEDLREIQGEWDMRLTIEFDSDDVISPLLDIAIMTGHLTISSQGVKSGENYELEWSYDGSILKLRREIQHTSYSVDCGSVYKIGMMTLLIPIDSSTESTSISGYLNGTAYSDLCGPVDWDGTIEGFLMKR
jgi:hypothetical protein